MENLIKTHSSVRYGRIFRCSILFLTFSFVIGFFCVPACLAQNGVTYSYDAAGNRIMRKPNTIVLGALTTGENKPSFFDDSFWGDLVQIKHTAGSYQFDVHLKGIHSTDSCHMEILHRLNDQTPVLVVNNTKTQQYVDMAGYASGKYYLRIRVGKIESIWSITVV